MSTCLYTEWDMVTSLQVGSGYTMGELRELGHKLKPHWKKFDTKWPPDCIIIAPGFRVSPHDYVAQQLLATAISMDHCWCWHPLTLLEGISWSIMKIFQKKLWCQSFEVHMYKFLYNIIFKHFAKAMKITCLLTYSSVHKKQYNLVCYTK